MERLVFYLQYAARNLWRSRRWSSFAMLSVAAGVATVVALRSLGLAIGDSLTTNVRASNHGDIRIVRALGPRLGAAAEDEVFNDYEMGRIHTWVEARDARMAEYLATVIQVSTVHEDGFLSFASAILIDPETYPVTQDIVALEPKGVSLGDLFRGGPEVVISENLAESAEVGIGDEMHISGTTETFIVRGIVSMETEAGFWNMIAAFFGFVYMDRAVATEYLSIDARPNGIGILMPEGASYADIEAAGEEIKDIVQGEVVVTTVPELIEQNEVIADVIGRFIVVMGLGAMLIGGVGIINTMLVMVRRRTVEIAALKTFGLKGRQIAMMFMTEALLLGLIGSIIGATGGALLSRLTLAYGEAFVLQSLRWRLYPEAVIFGVVLGFVVTGVFGVMPVLTAVKIRPGIILRPNETHIPVLGALNSIGVTFFVVLSLGVIVGQIIGPLPDTGNPLNNPLIPSHLVLGIFGVASTLLILGIMVLLLWVVVWMVGKLPAFGWVDMKLALKNLSTHRLRTATTLLAISAGMFAISSITFYSASVREILQMTLTETFGGNVMIISPASFPETAFNVAGNAQRLLDEKLDELDGVVYRTRITTYEARMNQVDDLSLRDRDVGIDREALRDEMRAASREGDFERVREIAHQLYAMTTPLTISMWDSDNPDLRPGEIIAGRGLAPTDKGERVVIVALQPRMQEWGVAVGSTITVGIEGQEFGFEVIGLVQYNQIGPPGMFGDIAIPAETLGDINADFQINTVQVEPEAVNRVMREIMTMPFFFALNVELFDNIIGRFIDQFAALPLLVGILSLGAAAVIMANTVALATLERRRQIGILKAIGLKSRRVLSVMLLENTLVSLLGGILGIGLTVLGIASLTIIGWEDLALLPRDARPIAAGLIAAAVLIGSTATLLSANAAVRERVLNVLRYE